jgi:hypothetical protein
VAEKTADPETGRRRGKRTGPAPAACEVSLYLRASPTAVGKRRQERVEKRLTALADDGEVGSLSVERWPGQIRVSPGEESPAVARYEELAAAADEAGARLVPFFEDRGGIDGFIQSYADTRVLTVPVLAVVVEHDGEVVGLYPCRRDGAHDRVEEAVDALAAGESAANLR